MPYADSSPQTLIVDGTDLQSLSYLYLGDTSGLYAPGLRRGGDDPIPGAQGLLAATDLVLDAYAFSIVVLLEGTTEADFETNLRAAITLCMGTSGNGLVTLTRRLAITTGPGYVEHTAPGRFVASNAFALLNSRTGTTELQFINLKGAWSNDSGATYTIVP